MKIAKHLVALGAAALFLAACSDTDDLVPTLSTQAEEGLVDFADVDYDPTASLLGVAYVALGTEASGECSTYTSARQGAALVVWTESDTGTSESCGDVNGGNAPSDLAFAASGGNGVWAGTRSGQVYAGSVTSAAGLIVFGLTEQAVGSLTSIIDVDYRPDGNTFVVTGYQADGPDAGTFEDCADYALVGGAWVKVPGAGCNGSTFGVEGGSADNQRILAVEFAPSTDDDGIYIAKRRGIIVSNRVTVAGSGRTAFTGPGGNPVGNLVTFIDADYEPISDTYVVTGLDANGICATFSRNSLTAFGGTEAGWTQSNRNADCGAANTGQPERLTATEFSSTAGAADDGIWVGEVFNNRQHQDNVEANRLSVRTSNGQLTFNGPKGLPVK